MFCFKYNKCNKLDCPVKQQKIHRCWLYFEKNAALNPEYKKQIEICKKCNYKLGWEIGLISEKLFEEQKEEIFIDELIPNTNLTNTASENTQNKERFCYEVMKCNNINCPVRKQQIIKCFNYFKSRNKEEKEKITSCNRDCDNCFYKSGWDIGLLSEDNFTDIIERKKIKLKKQNQYKNNILIEIYMAELAKKPLTHEEEIELAKKIAGDKKASEIFLLANLKLVTRIAKKFSNKIPFLDLIQEGNIGLIKAISKFDYRLGYKFSTYAAYWIKYYMQKAVSEQSTSISIPCHLIAVANKIKLHIQKFEEELSRPPTLDELSDILSISKDKIINILNITKTPISIYSKTSNEDDENETLEYYIEDKNSLTPEEAYLEKQKIEAVKEALTTLNDRQRYVVENYYGINCDEKNLAEIGREENISRERVRQILLASLIKLSKHSSIISLQQP